MFQYRVESFATCIVTCKVKKLTNMVLLQHIVLDIESIAYYWDDLLICGTSIIGPIDATPHHIQVK
jgi:hypothetical protein